MAQYLVRGAYVDPGPLLPPAQVADMIERSVSPSWEAIAELQRQGKIVGGGLVAADRAVVLLVEADSNDEVGTLIHDLPFWGLVKWEVTPLESFESRSALDTPGCPSNVGALLQLEIQDQRDSVTSLKGRIL